MKSRFSWPSAPGRRPLSAAPGRLALPCVTLLLTLGAAGCTPRAETEPEDDPRVGGQSGDDGDVSVPPGGEPPIGPFCQQYEERVVPAGTATQLGPDAAALLAGVASQSPAFWVAYDTPFVGTRYAPGPGETRLSIALSLRDGAPEGITEWGPPETSADAGAPARSTSALCTPEVRVPAWVELDTADGALAERLPATIRFHGPRHAELSERIAASELRGDFRVLEVQRYDADWELDSLYLDVDLWQGGSSGRIEPDFRRLVAIDPAEEPPPPDDLASPPLEPPPNEVSLPERWRSLLVWPRREVCRSGDPVARDEPVVGFSAADVVAALGASSDWSLEVASDAVAARFALDALPELACASAAPMALGLELPGTLTRSAPGSASPPDAGTLSDAPLAGLAARDAFALIADVNPWQDELSEIRFERRRVYGYPELDRAGIERELGIDLDALGVGEQYQRFWWSWAGRLSRDANGRWEGTAELLLSSLNREQQAADEREIASGGPGAGVGHGPSGLILPGDVLLRASATRAR